MAYLNGYHSLQDAVRVHARHLYYKERNKGHY